MHSHIMFEARPVKEKKIATVHDLRNSYYVNLSNKRVLYMYDQDTSPLTTILEISSINNLKTPLMQRTIEGYWLHYLGLSQDNAFYLWDECNDKILKICSETLRSLSTAPVTAETNFYSAKMIGNESFMTIYANKGLYYLRIHKWKNNAITEHNITKLSVPAKISNESSLCDIRHIAGNRWCALLERIRNNHSAGVLIFDISPNTLEINEIGLIKPTTAPVRPNSRTKQREIIRVFPNGNLITIDSYRTRLQVWDTQTLTCLKTWDFENVRKPDNFDISSLEITPLVDNKHLLFVEAASFFLFSIENGMMRNITFKSGYFPLPRECNHSLINGQLLLHCGNKSEQCMIIQTDLNEIKQYREKMTKYNVSKYITTMFLNNHFPPEITDQVLSQAFTPEQEKIFSERKIRRHR